MEALKKNLHFAVFGAGVLIGLILVGVAYMVKSGKVSQVEEAVGKLAKPSPATLPTKGDLEKAQASRNSFNKDIEAAIAALQTGNGTALKQGLGTNPNPNPRTYYSQDAEPVLQDLKRRFAAMEKPIRLPEAMGERTLPPRGMSGSTPGQTFIEKKMSDINSNTDPLKVARFQIDIRILQEICFTCEKLVQLDQFKDMGVRVNDVKFEDARGGEGVSAESPWEEYTFVVDMECHPDFPAALAAELSNPSKLTEGSSDKDARKNGQARWLFPIMIDDVQTAMRERPKFSGYDIPLSAREKEGIPPGEKANAPEVQRIAAEKAKALSDSVKVVLPVDAAVRCRALSFNRNWRFTATEQPQQP